MSFIFSHRPGQSRVATFARFQEHSTRSTKLSPKAQLSWELLLLLLKVSRPRGASLNAHLDVQVLNKLKTELSQGTSLQYALKQLTPSLRRHLETHLGTDGFRRFLEWSSLPHSEALGQRILAFSRQLHKRGNTSAAMALLEFLSEHRDFSSAIRGQSRRQLQQISGGRAQMDSVESWGRQVLFQATDWRTLLPGLLAPGLGKWVQGRALGGMARQLNRGAVSFYNRGRMGNFVAGTAGLLVEAPFFGVASQGLRELAGESGDWSGEGLFKLGTSSVMSLGMSKLLMGAVHRHARGKFVGAMLGQGAGYGGLVMAHHGEVALGLRDEVPGENIWATSLATHVGLQGGMYLARQVLPGLHRRVVELSREVELAGQGGGFSGRGLRVGLLTAGLLGVPGIAEASVNGSSSSSLPWAWISGTTLAMVAVVSGRTKLAPAQVRTMFEAAQNKSPGSVEVFADWANSEGLPQGELMSVKAALDDPDTIRTRGVAAHQELLDRYREIQKAIRDSRGDLENGIDRVVERNGFVWELVLSKHAYREATLPALERILSGAGGMFFSRMDVSQVSQVRLQAFLEFARAKQVRALTLRGKQLPTLLRVWEKNAWPELEALVLEGQPTDEGMFKFLDSKGLLQSLRALELRQVSWGGWFACLTSAGSHSLQFLKMESSSSTVRGGDLTRFLNLGTTFPALQFLVFTGQNQVDLFYPQETLRAVPPSLRYLDFSGIPGSAGGLTALSEVARPDLRVLSLAGPQSGVALSPGLNLDNLSGLREFRLQEAGFSASSLSVLAHQLGRLPHLEILDLGNNHLTVREWDSLWGGAGFARLRSLSWAGNRSALWGQLGRRISESLPSSLDELDLRDTDLHPLGLELLLEGSLPRERLYLEGNGLANDVSQLGRTLRRAQATAPAEIVLSECANNRHPAGILSGEELLRLQRELPHTRLLMNRDFAFYEPRDRFWDDLAEHRRPGAQELPLLMRF